MRLRIDLDDVLYEQLVALAEADLRPLDLEVMFLLRCAVEERAAEVAECMR